jgi:DNA-directed RNA polymerase specialized sigma24 family protein
VQTTPQLKLGFPPAWESEAVTILNQTDDTCGFRLPPNELRRRVLHKLRRLGETKSHINGLDHFRAIVRTMIRQALVDFSRQRSREYKDVVYDFNFDLETIQTGLPNPVADAWADLLSDESPLDESEKALLQLALDDPSRFIKRNGKLHQRALASKFGVHQTTMRNRWLRIVEKVAEWRNRSTPEIEVSL